MQYIIQTPKSWRINEKSKKEVNVYLKILSKFKENDIVFEIIKKNGEIKKLNKKQCAYLSRNFASEIKKNIKNKNSDNQLKIMGIIGASEESVILMLASLILGAHHCICFEDLSPEAIYQRLDIFKPDILVCKKHLRKKVESALAINNEINKPIIVIDVNKIDNLISCLDINDKPERCYDPVPKCKKSNYKLHKSCFWCNYKFDCFKDVNNGQGLRGFKYANSTVYLTHVEVEPQVEEIL